MIYDDMIFLCVGSGTKARAMELLTTGKMINGSESDSRGFQVCEYISVPSGGGKISIHHNIF